MESECCVSGFTCIQLYPMKKVKSIHITQEFNSLRFVGRLKEQLPTTDSRLISGHLENGEYVKANMEKQRVQKEAKNVSGDFLVKEGIEEMEANNDGARIPWRFSL